MIEIKPMLISDRVLLAANVTGLPESINPELVESAIGAEQYWREFVEQFTFLSIDILAGDAHECDSSISHENIEKLKALIAKAKEDL